MQVCRHESLFPVRSFCSVCIRPRAVRAACRGGIRSSSGRASTAALSRTSSAEDRGPLALSRGSDDEDELDLNRAREREREEEERRQPVLPDRKLQIPVIPRPPRGADVVISRLPNILGIKTEAYDPETFVEETVRGTEAKGHWRWLESMAPCRWKHMCAFSCLSIEWSGGDRWRVGLGVLLLTNGVFRDWHAFEPCVWGFGPCRHALGRYPP